MANIYWFSDFLLLHYLSHFILYNDSFIQKQLCLLQANYSGLTIMQKQILLLALSSMLLGLFSSTAFAGNPFYGTWNGTYQSKLNDSTCDYNIQKTNISAGLVYWYATRTDCSALGCLSCPRTDNYISNAKMSNNSIVFSASPNDDQNRLITLMLTNSNNTLSGEGDMGDKTHYIIKLTRA